LPTENIQNNILHYTSTVSLSVGIASYDGPADAEVDLKLIDCRFCSWIIRLSSCLGQASSLVLWAVIESAYCFYSIIRVTQSWKQGPLAPP